MFFTWFKLDLYFSSYFLQSLKLIFLVFIVVLFHDKFQIISLLNILGFNHHKSFVMIPKQNIFGIV